MVKGSFWKIGLNSLVNKDRFINDIRRFMEIQKLSVSLLWKPIDEMLVYETENVGKNAIRGLWSITNSLDILRYLNAKVTVG